MKSTLLRLGALLLTLSVGLTVTQYFKNHYSIESLPPVPLVEFESAVLSRCSRADELIFKDMPPGFSLPNDEEIYFGKGKVALSEISVIARKLSRNPFQVVFIKSGGDVKFETVMRVAAQLKSADIRCIEFVLDKKKKSVVE